LHTKIKEAERDADALIEEVEGSRPVSKIGKFSDMSPCKSSGSDFTKEGDNTAFNSDLNDMEIAV